MKTENELAQGELLRAFEVGVKGTDWTRTVHALTAGKAKADYLRDVSEPWPDVKFTDITCRCLGGPVTDDGFRKTATYRGVPFAKIGMRVEVGGDAGQIAGNNSSANFDVLFTAGKHKGLTLNCHPNWMFKYFGDNGEVLAEFGGAA
jgi:hypothetical protein